MRGNEALTSATQSSPLPPSVVACVRADDSNERMRAVVQAHFDFVWRSARRLGVREADADDAAQKVFLVAAQKLDRIESGRERAFLFQTALRVASHIRRRYRADREVLDQHLQECGDDRPNLEDLTDQHRLRALADSVMEEMPLDLRAVLVLHEVQEMTTPEIAEMLGIPLGTAASRLRRAREDFRTREFEETLRLSKTSGRLP